VCNGWWRPTCERRRGCRCSDQQSDTDGLTEHRVYRRLHLPTNR